MRVGFRTGMAACLLVAVAGCMTGYQPRGYTGGYSEQKIDEDTYLVSFSGNGNTPRGVVLKYFLYRCAELTVDHGYAYFELYAPPRKQSLNETGFVKTAGRGGAPTYTYIPATPVTRWSAMGVVRMYSTEILAGAPTLFAAREVLAELGSEVRSGQPGATMPEKFRSVEGDFPVMPLRRKTAEPRDAPEGAGPVNLDDLKGLMK